MVFTAALMPFQKFYLLPPDSSDRASAKTAGQSEGGTRYLPTRWAAGTTNEIAANPPAGRNGVLPLVDVARFHFQ